MAMEQPDMDPELARILGIMNYCLAACFTFECILKVITFSFKRYMKERANQLDLFIVVTTLVEIALTSVGGVEAVRSLRVLRAIRPLKVLTRSRGMRLMLKSVALSIGAMVGAGEGAN
jgi:hypothetical protein